MIFKFEVLLFVGSEFFGGFGLPGLAFYLKVRSFYILDFSK